jgi:hypothetical protein
LYQVPRFCGPGDLGWLAPLAKRASEGGTCPKNAHTRLSLLDSFGGGNVWRITYTTVDNCLDEELPRSKLTMLPSFLATFQTFAMKIGRARILQKVKKGKIFQIRI